MQTLIFFRSQFCNFVFCKNSCLEIMPWYHGPCQWEIFYQIMHTIPANIFIAWMNYATRINILRFNYEFMANLSETFWASKSVAVSWKRCLQKIHKIYKKTPATESCGEEIHYKCFLVNFLNIFKSVITKSNC